MIVAIHQPHYFPWLGYLAKMASVDKFILMDTVQLSKGSYMLRNRVVDCCGDIKYLTISAEKHGFLEREYRDIRTKDFLVWTNRQKNLLINVYRECNYFDEIWEAISPIFCEEHDMLCDTTIHSINILREIFDIDTPLILQSSIEVEADLKKDKLVLGLCKAVSADTYYSGNGARSYMDDEMFEKAGVHVIYQDFQHPIYDQMGNHPFVPGLSAIDLLFNNGIEKSRDIFWASVEGKRK